MDQSARDEMPGGYLVSTVFLGIEMERVRALRLNADPVLFETMVFKDEGDERVRLAGQRYATRAEALAGHAKAVAAVQEVIDHGQ